MGIEATIVILLWIAFGYMIGRMHQYSISESKFSKRKNNGGEKK